jgi:hypothetical protein
MRVRFPVSFLLVLVCASASAASVEDALSRFVLQNEQGLNEPPTDSAQAPLGLFVSLRENRLVTACNAVHGKSTEKQGWIFTSRHCWPSGPKQDLRMFFISFHRRTGKQISVPLSSSTPVALSVVYEKDKPAFEADLMKVPMTLENARKLDSIDIFGTTATDESPSYALWVYRFDKDGAADSPQSTEIISLTLQRYPLEGKRGASPRFKATYGTFSVDYTLSYSKQGKKGDELFGIFLEGTQPPPASSGGLLMDGQNQPIGLFHSVLSVNTFKTLWDADFKYRFERAAKAEKIQTPLDPAKFEFSLIGVEDEKILSLNREETLYGVALDLNAVKRLNPAFLTQTAP